MFPPAALRARAAWSQISADKTAEIFYCRDERDRICFTRKGEMIVATSEAVYSLPLSVYGTSFGLIVNRQSKIEVITA
jgi:hypothetical protein